MIEYHEERFDNLEETAVDVCNRMAKRGWEVVQTRIHSVIFKRDSEKIETRNGADGGYRVPPEMVEGMEAEIKRRQTIDDAVNKALDAEGGQD
jgi:hypothetical protein